MKALLATRSIFLAIILLTISGIASAGSVTVATASTEPSTLNIQCGTASNTVGPGAAGTPIACSASATALSVSAPSGSSCTACVSGGQLVAGTFSCGTATGATFALASSSGWSGAGGADNCGTPPPPPTGTLSAPSNVQASNVSQTSQTIGWTASTDSANPDAVITYTVNITPAPSVPVQSVTTTSTTVTGLQSGVPYTVTVSATDPTNTAPVTSTPAISFTIPATSGIPAYQTNFYNAFYSQNPSSPYGVNAPPGHFGKNPIIDARNFAIGNNFSVDAKQINAAGFSVVRAYQEPAETWEIIIKEAAKNNQSVVYQVVACQNIPNGYSGAAYASMAGQCVNMVNKKLVQLSPPQSFNDLIASEIAKLNTVISKVGVSTFNSTVKLVLVGNEDLLTIPDTTDDTNANDLVSAMQQTRNALTAAGVSASIPVSTSIQGPVMMGYNPSNGQNTLTSRLTLAKGIQAANSGAQAVLAINHYPNQWGVPANCAAGGNCTSTMCTSASNCNMQYGPTTPAAASQFSLSNYIQQLQNTYNMAILIAETGWPTSGSDSEYIYTGTFTENDAVTFYSSVYPFLTSQQIPILAFEMYNELGKDAANPADAENHYGLMTSDNGIKNLGLLPPSNTLTAANNARYDSSKLAYIVFNGLQTGACTESSNCTFYPDKMHVTLTRTGFSNPIMDQDFKVYVDNQGNPIWPQLLVQNNDVVTISTLANPVSGMQAQSCQGTVVATPYLENASNDGDTHTSAQFSTSIYTGYNGPDSAAYAGFLPTPGSGTQTTVCGGIYTTPTDKKSPANVWGMNLLATNLPSTLNVTVIITNGETQGYISIPGTVCDSSKSPAKNSACSFTGGSGNLTVPNVAVGAAVTFTLTNNNGICNSGDTIESTLTAGGVWNPGGNGIGCGSNFTNAGAGANASIWLP